MDGNLQFSTVQSNRIAGYTPTGASASARSAGHSPPRGREASPRLPKAASRRPAAGRAAAALRRQERFEEPHKLRARAFLRGIRPDAETHRRFRHRIHGTQHPHADTIAHHTRTNPERQPLPPAHGREYPDRNRQLHLEDRHAGIAVQTDRRLHALHRPRRQQLPYDDLHTREPCATRSTNPPQVPCTTS